MPSLAWISQPPDADSANVPTLPDGKDILTALLNRLTRELPQNRQATQVLRLGEDAAEDPGDGVPHLISTEVKHSPASTLLLVPVLLHLAITSATLKEKGVSIHGTPSAALPIAIAAVSTETVFNPFIGEKRARTTFCDLLRMGCTPF
ncbi:Little Elongation Complex Subunit 1 [Manis pentadactyla]|nr:Little Elongation Complex Subunit 1 [Manis pentadactyla]